MMNFKNFLIEEKDEKDMVREIHHLPMYSGHEGVADTANALEDIHDHLVGKKSSIPKTIEQDGIPIMFGVHKKQFFIELNGVKVSSFDDIDQNFQEPMLNQILKQAATLLPSILPRHSKFYGGKISLSDNNKLAISIETDQRGNPIKDKDLAEFKPNDNVDILDNSVQADPSNYTPEDQNEFLMHMNNARKAYSKMDPDALELINGHQNNIKKYINDKDLMNDKHSIEDFINYLMIESKGKMLRKQKDATKEGSDKLLKKHEKNVNHILQNEKHFKNVLDMIRSLSGSSKVLSNVLSKNGNKGNLILHHSDGKKSKLKIPKSINEEITTSSSGDMRGMGYVSGNPGGGSPGYRGGNVIDSDQRNNILLKLFKDFHHRHHTKGKK